MAQIQTDENTLRKIIREEIREGVEAITGPKFDEINGKFTEINGKFDEVNSQFKHIDKRFDTIESEVAEIKLRQSITDKKLDAVIEEFKDHEERLTRLEKTSHQYK